MVVFTLVLQGCPRKVLFLHWFYKVVREKCCFYIGFTRVVREKWCFTLVLQGKLADNSRTTRTWFWPQQQQQDVNWPHNSPSCRIESLISRSLARTHKGLTQDSHQNHGKSIGFTRLSAKKVVFTLVLPGCPRKRLFLHRFYMVFRGQPS